MDLNRARQRVREVIGQVGDRSFPDRPRPRKRRDWRLYGRAQTHGLADMLRLSRTTVVRYGTEHPEPSPVRSSRRGRPSIPREDLVKVPLL